MDFRAAIIHINQMSEPSSSFMCCWPFTDKIHELLCSGLGDYAPSIQTVRKWVADIQSGQEDMEDLPRSGRPEIVSDGAHVQQVAALLQEDRCQTCEQLAGQLDISSATLFTRSLLKSWRKRNFLPNGFLICSQKSRKPAGCS